MPLNRLDPFHRAPPAAPTSAQVEANVRHLVWDITWFGVLWGSVVTFLQVYVVRLGGSGLLVSTLTYGPALIAIFWQIPAGRLITRAGHRMRWVIGSGFIYRLFFLAVALVPFVFSRSQAEITTAIWVISAFASSVSNVAFLSMMADAVPSDRMTQVVGWRIAGFGVANTLTTLLGGQLLQRLPFPINYQIFFLIGYAASLVSWWHVLQLRVPDRPPDHSQHPAFWRDLNSLLHYPRFGRFLVGVGVMQLALGMMAPSLPLYWVRNLSASDGQVSAVLTIASATMVVGSLLMRRAVEHFGRERALAAGALGYALYPLITSFTPSVWWLLPWAALAGFFNAAITVTLFENLVSVTPEADRTNYIAVYNVIMNLALFAGPIIAGLLARDAAGVVLALRLAAGVGVVAGALLALRQNH
ncbi:MAG: MFS transporter [Anaerolineae bacterium]|nr:MFS transporter [Anaerolineae bacterium]